MPHLRLRSFLLIFLFGVWISQYAIALHYVLLIFIISILLLLQFKRWWLVAPLILCGAIVIAHDEIRRPSIPNFTNSQVQTYIGHVSSFPDIRLDHQKVYLTLSSSGSTRGSRRSECLDCPIKSDNKIKILVHLPLDQSVAYGDELKVTGKLSDPPRLEGFNYRKYLERFGVQKIMKAPKSIEILCRGCEGNWVTRRASGLRNWMGSNLKASLPSPHRELAMGILLGVKKELPPSVKQSFQDSGLQHILVVSGSNIAIVMLCFQMVFRRFGPYINALFSILGIVFFVLMAGGDAPVIRAALMGSLAGIGVAGGQKIDVINALLLSSCLMGLAIPSMIQSDLGFWLSFGATMGIIVFTPIFALLLQTIQIPNSKYQITKSTSSSVPEFLNSHVWLSAILKILSMSLGAQLAVLPLLLLFFGSFPLGGVFANIFIEPLMPMLMLGSSILGLCGSLSSGLVWPFRAVVYFGFEILLSLSQWFSHFPALEIPQKLSFLSLIALLVLGLLLVLHPKLSEIHLAKPAK